MDVEDIIDATIGPELVKAFGRQTANALITQATLAYASTDGPEQEKFEAFVQTICTDPRVTAVWGETGACERIEDWNLDLQDAILARAGMKGESMTAEILDGRAMAKVVRQEILAEVEAFEDEYGFAPAIAVVRVGSDPASVSYGKMIKRSFESAGMTFGIHILPETASQDEVIDLIATLNADGRTNGIMLQEPVPRGLDEDELKATIRAIKDADGVNPINAGRLAQAGPVRDPDAVPDYLVPATPLGGLEMLKRAGVQMEGQRAVVVGRSNIVGRPMSFLLMQHNATVSMCHSRTRPLGAVTSEADILCTAVGVPHLIKGGMIKPGAVVIDFGFNRLGDQWVGDVDFEEAKEVAAMITPVPGGTGSMTNVMLMRNVLQAATRQMQKGRS